MHPAIRGEDVATVMLRMASGATVVCHLGYPEHYLEREAFPHTFVFAEGDRGSLDLGPDYRLSVTTEEGTFARRYPPPRYDWVDPAYEVAQASVVPRNANLVRAICGEGEAETTGEDNLRTVRLVFAAYESAARDEVVRLD